MTTTSFTSKKIDVDVTLYKGVFSDTGQNSARLTGLRVAADIEKSGQESVNSAIIRVWGLPQQMMNELTTMGAQQSTQINSSIVVSAGDDNGMAVVYSGDVMQAGAEYQNAPEVPFTFTSQAGQLAAIKPDPALSYKGGVDAAVIMKELAARMSLQFENNFTGGMSGVKLMNPVFPGTARAKAAACARAARINWTIDDGVLAIWPANGSRAPLTGSILQLTPQSGLMGYPRFGSNAQMYLTCLFNPAIRNCERVHVTSEIKPACGDWTIIGMSHALESELPGGQWFTSLTLVSQDGYAY